MRLRSACKRTRAPLIPHQEVLESKACLTYNVYIDPTVDINIHALRTTRSTSKGAAYGS